MFPAVGLSWSSQSRLSPAFNINKLFAMKDALAFGLTLLICWGVHLTSASAEARKCSVERYGGLTTFKGETARLSFPCEYLLADFTCQNYLVEAIVGMAMDSVVKYLFSPSTIRVKVTNITSEDVLDILSSQKMLEEFSADKIINPWKKMEGSLNVVDFADYYSTNEAAAVIIKDVFSIEFSEEEASVVVTCPSAQLLSMRLPASLCGDGSAGPKAQVKSDVISEDIIKYHLFGEISDREPCLDLTPDSLDCEDRDDALEECSPIYTNPNIAQYLDRSGTSLRDYFLTCLNAVCVSNPTDLQ
ncbi:uncharacterized protein [Littorina saxatilis]|uniref:uncharacterized protein isoform X2 n=1 Tax=Littorina saxatilis TaxID=31220 RepID=UPI0038B472BC